MNALSKLDARRPQPGRKQPTASAPAARINLLAVLVPNDPGSRSLIRAEAAKRDITSAQLLQRLVATVATDRLFAAVLDDGDETGRGQ